MGAIVDKANIRSITTIALIAIFGGVFVGITISGDTSQLVFTQAMWEQMFSLFIGLIIGVFAWLGITRGNNSGNTP